MQRHMKRAQMAKVSRVFHMHMCKQPALCSRYNQRLENMESERKIIRRIQSNKAECGGGRMAGRLHGLRRSTATGDQYALIDISA